MTKARINDKDFIEESLKLYEEYNKYKLFYKELDRFDLLVTADPFTITQKQFDTIEENGTHLLNWLREQKNLLKEAYTSKSLHWLKEYLEKDASDFTVKTQESILKKKPIYSSIMRADLSSLPYGCHESQLRWGGLPHIHYVGTLFNKVIRNNDSVSPNKNIFDYFKRILSRHCSGKNEFGLYLSPDKYLQGNKKIQRDVIDSDKKLQKMKIVLVEDFNEKNYTIKNSRLVEKSTNNVISLIFRKQISLETLGKTAFGREITKLYLDGALRFEPDLDIVNDMKIGMALAFDKRTRNFFSDQSRSLFLKTALADKQLLSFNSVFNTNYKNIEDFISRTTKSKRRFIYKYAGMEMFMSFGGSYVFRLDDSENHVRQILSQNGRAWILQELDRQRFTLRYLKGNYDKPETCRIATSDKFKARIELFYYVEDEKVELISTLANFVNDHWKARLKSSDQKEGTGALMTPLHIKG